MLFDSVALIAESLAEQVEILAKNLERTGIARDIHDSLGHTLTSLDIQLKVAQKLRDRNLDQAFQAIDMATVLSAQCIEDVSQAVKTMRRSDFDLNHALNNLIEQVKNNDALQVTWAVNLPELTLSTTTRRDPHGYPNARLRWSHCNSGDLSTLSLDENFSINYL